MKKTKLTFWLIGFGCGMMVTSMIGVLFTLNLLKANDTYITKSDILASTTSIIEVVPDEDMNSNIKNEETTIPESKQETPVETTEKTEPENKPELEVQSENKPESDNQTETPKTCQITITDNLSGYDICNLLQEKGLVDNAEAFRKYIWSQGKAKALNSGTITIPYGLSYAELLSWLTS